MNFTYTIISLIAAALVVIILLPQLRNILSAIHTENIHTSHTYNDRRMDTDNHIRRTKRSKAAAGGSTIEPSAPSDDNEDTTEPQDSGMETPMKERSRRVR